MNKTNDKTNNYMGREIFITVDEKGIYRGYVQLDDNDDIFRLDYAEKMTIESLDDDWCDDDYDDDDDDWFDDDDEEDYDD